MGTPSFRPLTGIVVLIFMCWSKYARSSLIKFPSPYGDCGSYHRVNEEYGRIFTGFRPLTGIVVLISR